MARSITEPGKQANALAAVAFAVVAAGDDARAQTVGRQAEAVARSITNIRGQSLTAIKTVLCSPRARTTPAHAGTPDEPGVEQDPRGTAPAHAANSAPGCSPA